jgi:hypothetical protein
MAFGARFLKVTPWSWLRSAIFHSTFQNPKSTYSLVKVNCVFARNDISDGRALSLAGGLLDGLGRHFYATLESGS